MFRLEGSGVLGLRRAEGVPGFKVADPGADNGRGAGTDPLLDAVDFALAAIVHPVDLVLIPPHQRLQHAHALLLVLGVLEAAAQVRLAALLVLHGVGADLAAALVAPADRGLGGGDCPAARLGQRVG